MDRKLSRKPCLPSQKAMKLAPFPKKPWRTPSLKVFGTLEEITQFKTGCLLSDGLSGGSISC